MPDNAANRDSYPFSAPGTAYSTTPSLQFEVPSARGRLECKITNPGRGDYNPPQSSNSVVCKWQESDDGSSWSDMDDVYAASSERTIVPGGVQTVEVNVSKVYLRLLAYGNAAGMLDTSFDARDGLGLRVV